MQTNTAKPTTYLMTFAGMLLLVSGLLVSPAMGAWYAKFDGIDGESTDKDHKDWIDILAFNKSITVPPSSSTRPGAPQASDLSLSKYIDKASPQLALYCCTGQHIPEVTLELVSDNQQRLPYYRIKMKRVFVSSYSVGGDQNQSPLPTEEITLNFEEIEWTYIEYDGQGRVVAEHTTSWDFEGNTPGIGGGGGFIPSPQ